jgi:hypothetical protein
MAISEAHASHIRKVRVAFFLEAPELDPDEVPILFQVRATSAAWRGDERLNYSGHVLGLKEHGWWRFLDAFNRHDLDAIMGYFADDCVFYMPRGAGPRGDLGVSEWTLTGTATSGQRLAVRGVDLLEFVGGRITRKDSFWKIVE